MKIYFRTDTFKPRSLKACGVDIWGPQWKGPAGDFLGVTRTTINRWCNGSIPVPLPVSQALRLRRKLKELTEAEASQS